jgi:hypothetical protein
MTRDLRTVPIEAPEDISELLKHFKIQTRKTKTKGRLEMRVSGASCSL